MAQATKPLTVRQVETIKKPGGYGDGGGLYLEVAPGGSKSWSYRYQIAGKRRVMGLGSVGDVGLAEARERRDVQRRLVAAGIDPLEAKALAKAAAHVAALAVPTTRLFETLEPTVARSFLTLFRASSAICTVPRNASHTDVWADIVEI